MPNIKNLTKKIKNKKLKGNISLLVILVLLATSVITLLSINQIMRLISYWNQTFNYFRAYYIAKAWTELWLAEVYNREDGFNNRISSGSYIVIWNLLEEYSAFNPYFDTIITWSFKFLTNDIRESNECSWNNKITLNSGAGIMLSLFYDNLSNSTDTKKILSDYSGATKLDDNYIKDFELSGLDWEWDWANKYFTYWLFDYDDDWNMNNIFVETWNNNSKLATFLNNVNNLELDRKYLTIKNSGTWDEIAKFCITNNHMLHQLIPYSNSLITTIWHYGDTEVWIQSIVKKGVPDRWLNNIY